MSKKIRDVLDVLKQAKARFNTGDRPPQIPQIRRAAIRVVANRAT